MESVFASHVTPFSLSIDRMASENWFKSVLFCSFRAMIVMLTPGCEIFVRSLGEGASEPKVRLK